MTGQLTTLIVQDNTPLPLNSYHRVLAAKKFMDSIDATEVIEALNKPEEYPPYYYGYKQAFHALSEVLNQYALNDFMALG